MKKFRAHCGVLEASESKIPAFISGCSTKSKMYFYGKIRQCCIKNDLLGLERLIDYLDKHELHPYVKLIGQVRLANLMEIVTTQMVEELVKQKEHFPPLMRGEVQLRLRPMNYFSLGLLQRRLHQAIHKYLLLAF